MTLHSDILLILNNTSKPLSCAELAEMLGKKDAYNLSRTLKRMYEDKKVRRLYGPGRSFLWAGPNAKFRDTYKPKRKRQFNNKPDHENRPNINPETLRGFLNKWSEDRWKPKVYESAQHLPLALGKLFELSAEVVFGSVIPQKELDHYRDKLGEFVNDALTLYLIATTILEIPELWDAEKLPEYLLTDASDPIKLQDLARKLKELNS